MNKTVLITGASSGLGKAAAKYFASHSWNVVATMRNPNEHVDLIKMKDTMVARLDVQDRKSIRQAIDAGIARFGKIDALINNAGFSLFGVFEGITREKIQEQFDVNVFGVMDVTRAILPHFRKNKGGLILNISSRAGIVALPMISLYCATKFALEGFSESLAYELAAQNIIVKIIEPAGGAAGTNFSKRMGEESAHDVPPPDYRAFVERTNAIFTGMRSAQQTSSDEIAQAIFGAATDGTDRLRYVVGNDAPPFMKARREMSDDGYVDFMRSRFLPKS